MANRTLIANKDNAVTHQYLLEMAGEGTEAIELTSNEVSRLNGNIIEYVRTEHKYGNLIHYYGRVIPWWEKEKIVKEYLAKKEKEEED